MLRLKQLLFEMSVSEISRLIKKIDNNEFRYIASGDNGRVYKINDEDLVFKITTSTDEIEVARRIQNKMGEYSTFIPVYYVGDLQETKYKDIIIMSNAAQLSATLKRDIDHIVEKYKLYLYEQDGEMSLFDFINLGELTNVNTLIINFIAALQSDIKKLGITDLDLDLDFKSDNIMIWNGNMVMVDW